MTLKDWIEKNWNGTMEELAKELGISRMHLWRYVTGKVKEPKWSTVQRIVEFTNGEVTPEDLVIPRKTPAGVR